jgi:drug/metabolite transporter (DMT)-like permease
LAFVAIKQADAELSPTNLALLRWFIACPLYLALIPLIGMPKTRLQGRDIPRFLLVGLANVAGYHLSLNYAETSVSAGLAGLLITFGPVFMVVLSVAFLRERAGPRVIIALLLAVVGAFVLSIDSVSLADLSSLSGPTAVILAAFFYAVFGVFGKPLVDKYGAPPTTIWAGLIGTVMLVPLLSPSFAGQAASLSLDGWASVLYLSVFSTVIGYLLFFTMASRGAVSSLSIQLYLAPVVSVVGGAIILRESVTVFTVIGGAMMLAAVAIVTRRKRN